MMSKRKWWVGTNGERNRSRKDLLVSFFPVLMFCFMT